MDAGTGWRRYSGLRTRSGSTTNITGASTVLTTSGQLEVTGHMSGDVYTWSGKFDVPAAFRDPGAVFRVIGVAQHRDRGDPALKAIPAALQAHYDSGATCMAEAILIQREDGQLFGFTGHDKPLVLDLSPWASASWELAAETAFEFDASQGLDVSTIVTTAGFNVDNLDLTTLDDGTLFDRDDVLAGRWRNAKFRIFRYRWDVAATIEDDVETLIRGTFGEITLGDTTITIELRGIAQKLQQPVGIVSQQTCRARYGEQGLGKCNKD
eukprot:gene18012-36745_t